jgi:hypothetical protein
MGANCVAEAGFLPACDMTFGATLVGALAHLGEGSAGLRILDVSDLTRVREVGYFDTPGAAYDVAVSGPWDTPWACPFCGRASPQEHGEP